jgi:tetratricopeptide (TPR) repeat protein
MADHYFLSYSRLDGKDFAARLADELSAGPPEYRVWLDARQIQPGRQDWDEQLVEAIQTCRALLFAMTTDSVRSPVCKDEWVWAMKYKKPVVPLLVHSDAELPFRLSSRQFVDFTGGFESGLAKLRSYLRWATTPEGVLHELRARLAESERELPRADPAQQPRIEREIDELRRSIEDQRRLVDDPDAAREQTEARIATALELQRQTEPPVAAARKAKFVNPPPMTAPGYFQDRYFETKAVADFVRGHERRLLVVVGRAGIGKTAMVCRLLEGLEAGRLPDDLGELAVDGIVYLAPTGKHAINFPNLFADLCRLLPEEQSERLLARYRDPHETPASLMRSLLDALPRGRYVVLLDNFEDLVDLDTFEITDREVDQALRTVLAAPEHAVKVIVTTRVAPADLLLARPGASLRLDVDAGLESPYAEEILRAMDPSGSLGLKDAPDSLLAQARERTRGFPRALEALAAILSADRDTTLPELLAEAERMPENVVEALVGEAFNRLDPLAQSVMQALAIYAVPMPPVAVDYLLQPYEPAIDSAPVLGRLVNMQFARRDAGRYYLHQVDREYALSRIPPGQTTDRDADVRPFSQYALRHRGADYFQQTRTDQKTWRTLDDLAPQLAEFELRCQGADYDAAASVLLGIDFDYLMLWGHYRLAIELHERVHGRIRDPWTGAGSDSSLGHALYLAGQITRATELYETALAAFRKIGDRQAEAACLGSLGNCHADLGEVRRAIARYDESLEIARAIRDTRTVRSNLGNLGNRYAELGEVQRAIEIYKQVLAMARRSGDRQGEATQLVNLGNRYAELGDSTRAIESYEQALAIAREIGYRRAEALTLGNLGEIHCDLGASDEAVRFCEEALEIADDIGLAQARRACRLVLATVHLHADDYGAAREAADVARSYDYAPPDPRVGVVLGIALAGERDLRRAADAFRDALQAAETLLGKTNERYDALDTKGLAVSGLAAVGVPTALAEAEDAFRAARAITSADGVVRRVLRLLDALGAGDADGALEPVRRAAAGPLRP